jgi:hypothetical protein
MTHDDDWKDILRDVCPFFWSIHFLILIYHAIFPLPQNGPETSIKDTKELLEHISKQFRIKQEDGWSLEHWTWYIVDSLPSGAIFLVSKSSTIPRFLPSLYMAPSPGYPHYSSHHNNAPPTDREYDEGSEGSDGASTGTGCSHCHTRRTSVWRRNKDGEQVCNLCAVYQRLRGKERPLFLGKIKIKLLEFGDRGNFMEPGPTPNNEGYEDIGLPLSRFVFVDAEYYILIHDELVTPHLVPARCSPTSL